MKAVHNLQEENAQLKKQVEGLLKDKAKNLKLDLNSRPQNLSPLTYFCLTKEYERLGN